MKKALPLVACCALPALSLAAGHSSTTSYINPTSLHSTTKTEKCCFTMIDYTDSTYTSYSNDHPTCKAGYTAFSSRTRYNINTSYDTRTFCRKVKFHCEAVPVGTESVPFQLHDETYRVAVCGVDNNSKDADVIEVD